MKNIKRILVINFGGIGDEILFLPTLISLKKEFPNSHVTLVLEPRSKGIADLTDTIDELMLIDVKGKHKYSELLKLIFKARLGKYNMVISSGGNKFISVLLFLTGINERYGFYTGELSEHLLTKALPLNKNQYAVNMYHDLIKTITKHKTEFPEITLKSDNKIKNSILIHPGVSKLSIEKGMIKTISAEKWAKIIDLLVQQGKHVILTGGPDDKECIETILNIVTTKEFENNFGQTKNLMDLAKLISKSEQFVCSDSAPLHIAVALKTRTYVIFGPTDDKKLIPQADFVTPLKTADNCTIKPCLWEHRQTTCENLACLQLDAQSIVDLILS